MQTVQLEQYDGSTWSELESAHNGKSLCGTSGFYKDGNGRYMQGMLKGFHTFEEDMSKSPEITHLDFPGQTVRLLIKNPDGSTQEIHTLHDGT